MAERLYPPPEPKTVSPEPEPEPASPEQEPETVPEPEPPKKAEPSARTGQKTAIRLRDVPRKWLILTVTALAAGLICLGVGIFILVDTYGMQVQLNKAQKENASAQAQVKQLEQKLDATTESLTTARAENKTLGSQVAELQSQLGEMESTVSQSTYDRDQALQKVESLTADVKTLTGEKEELQTQLQEAQTQLEDTQASLTETQSALTTAKADNAELEAQNADLSAQVDAYKAEVDFVDQYVVFVNLGASDRYYHKFSCPNFTQRNFLAYSVRLAESNGYSACPVCSGSGTANP